MSSCSKEEIERKRLAALEKRKNALAGSSVVNTTPKAPIKYTNKSNVRIGAHPYINKSNESNRKPDSTAIMVQNTIRSIESTSKTVSGTVYLISDTRFEVNPSDFSSPLLDIFKSIPSKRYDPKTHLWSFDISEYKLLMNRVSNLNPHVILGSIPQFVFKVLNDQSVDPNSVDLMPIESSLRNKLMPFQCDGVRFVIAKHGRCMIADDMGLGKTFQALAVASYYRHNWPLLIVTTSSMREVWQNKIIELLPSIPMMNVVTLSSGRDSQMVSDRQTQVVIVSYKIVTMYADLLKMKKFGFIIIDESHYLKSHKAQCTVSLTSIARTARRVILLSGTPALSRPAELYTQLNIISPNFFHSYTDYGKRYCAGKLTNFGWEMTGQSNLDELNIILQKKFLIRRTKENVLTSLQARTRETVILDQALMDWSKENKDDLSQMAATYMKTKSSDKHAALLTFFSQSARVKIPAVCKYIAQLVNEFKSEDKFLVFAHHKNMIDAISFTLDEYTIPYICIVGNTKTDTRAGLVDLFQSDSRCRCAVLSTTAANVGLTLTAAKLVIFAELHWNPGVLIQAESRAHRIGQEGDVCVQYLLAKGTSDDYMWPMIQDKLNVLNKVGLSGDTFEDTKLKIQETDKPSTQKTITDFMITNNEDEQKSFLEDNEGDQLLSAIDFT